MSSSSSSSSSLAVAPENAPQELTLNLQSVKQFDFEWRAVEVADYYQLFENPDGASGFTLIADNLPQPGYTLSVPLYQRANASYMVQACNTAACSDASESVSVDTNMAEAVGYLKAPITLGAVTRTDDYGGEHTVSQRFGRLALSGDGTTLAVATNNDVGGEAASGESAPPPGPL